VDEKVARGNALELEVMVEQVQQVVIIIE